MSIVVVILTKFKTKIKGQKVTNLSRVLLGESVDLACSFWVFDPSSEKAKKKMKQRKKEDPIFTKVL